MIKKKRGLGRGLDSLLSSSRESVAIDGVDESQNAESTGSTKDGALRHLPIEWLQPGRYQPRKDIQPEALEELAASIKSQGLMQPIIARKTAGNDNRFEIIAGERRWRACQLAQLDTVPVIIKDVEDEAAMAMALIENIQREDLNAMEEAQALYRLQHEFEMTQQQVAEAVGKNRATVANLLRLVNLNPDVKLLLEHGDIEMGHARALLGLEGEQQSEAATKVVSGALNVRQTEALVRNIQEGKKSPSKPEPKSPDINRLENILGDKLGAKVAISHTKKGKGKLVIAYNSLDELDGILSHIK